MEKSLNKFKEKWSKEHNKGFLGSTQVVLAVLIGLLTFLAVVFSERSSSCFDEVNAMRSEQVRELLEAHEPLVKWAGSWALRVLYEDRGDIDNAKAVSERTGEDASAWHRAKDKVNGMEDTIKKKESECDLSHTVSQVSSGLAILIVLVQLIVVWKLWLKYLYENKNIK